MLCIRHTGISGSSSPVDTGVSPDCFSSSFTGVAPSNFRVLRTVSFSKLKLLSSSFIILRVLTVSSCGRLKEKRASPLWALRFLGEKKMSS